MRWKAVLLAGGLMFAPAIALAQSTTAPQSTAPPSDVVGPSELQNFSLTGSAAKPADQQPQAHPKEGPAQTFAPAQGVQSSPPPEHRSAMPRQVTRAAQAVTKSPRPIAQAPSPTLSSAPAITTPPAGTISSRAPASPAPQPSFPAALSDVRAPAPGPGHGLPILPWALAGLILAGGTLFLLWRRRQRAAFAGHQFDMFVPPEPASTPPPPPPPPRAAVLQPVPPEASMPAKTGIVSSRLRPAIEISAQPVRCLIEEDCVVIEFELELYNAGTAPARAVLAEATLFNAGANQEQELAAFFANPVGVGERLEAIPPMKRVAFANRVVAPRSAIQEYDVGGRKALVPVLAFNALYQWSGGHAQTSAAFIVGRETKSDKLGPLGLDRMPREYRALAAHVLPMALRT